MIPTKGGAGQAVWLDTKAGRLFRLKKGVMTSARLVNDRLKGAPIRWVPVMVTLTYKDAAAWRPNHISDFMNRVQMYGKRRGYKLPYVWVMELQKRGAPHYHVLIWIPARLRLPKADRQGWWAFGSTNICRVKNAVGYVAKYASKFESKDCEFPKGARIHGIGGLSGDEKRVVAWWKLPKDLRTGDEGSVRWSKALGGGWINRDTGERMLPQWRVREAVYGAGMVSIEPAVYEPAYVFERETAAKHRVQSVKIIPRLRPAGSVSPGQQQTDMQRQAKERLWDDMVTRRCYLEALQETDHSRYVMYFEGVEQGRPASLASLIG